MYYYTTIQDKLFFQGIECLCGFLLRKDYKKVYKKLQNGIKKATKWYKLDGIIF